MSQINREDLNRDALIEWVNNPELQKDLIDNGKWADHVIGLLLSPKKWHPPKWVAETLVNLSAAIDFSKEDLAREKNRLIALAYTKEFGEGGYFVFIFIDKYSTIEEKSSIGAVGFSKEAAKSFAERLNNKTIEGWIYE